MSRSLLRTLLAIAVIVVTLVVFISYLRIHPEILRKLADLPAHTLALLFGLYIVFMGTLIWIQRATLTLCEIQLGRRESALLVSYSSIINFFGPLQSGPAFRAAYLKRRHNIKLKRYAVATLLYYGFYAVYSAIFLLAYFIGAWALLLAALAAIGLPFITRLPAIIPARFREVNLSSLHQLAYATLAQVYVLAVIFHIELNSLGQQVSSAASLIYTGAANFALFVSITPGAIGFRESFTVFTQQLHHIPYELIVGASLIDRAVYISMLAVLAIIVFGLHAQNYLKRD